MAGLRSPNAPMVTKSSDKHNTNRHNSAFKFSAIQNLNEMRRHNNSAKNDKNNAKPTMALINYKNQSRLLE